MANDDIWVVAESDDDFLRRQGATEREIVLAAGILDGISPARIGEVAGYGAGRSSDPEKQRQNWTSAVSRAAKRGGQVVTSIQVLIDALKNFRQHGEGPKVALAREVLEKLSTVVRRSSDAQVISAGKALLEEYRRNPVKAVTAKQVLKQLVAKIGPVRTKLGLELHGHDNLIHGSPELFEGVDYDPRLTKLVQELLEDDDGKSRPVARCAGDDSGNLDSGGSRRVGDDAAREVDRGPENAGSAGAGQRRDGSRDVERRLSELEKRHDRLQRTEALA